jgi:hypothetical protein
MRSIRTSNEIEQSSEEPTVAELVKKLPASHGTQKFITMFTRALIELVCLELLSPWCHAVTCDVESKRAKAIFFNSLKLPCKNCEVFNTNSLILYSVSNVCDTSS